MDTDFCLAAVEEAIQCFVALEIFNTDQGSQFTGAAFTGLLKETGIRICMDGRGCWRDNVFVERPWRSVKYEEVYLHAHESVAQPRAGIDRYLRFYNARRPHAVLARATMDQVFFNPPYRPRIHPMPACGFSSPGPPVIQGALKRLIAYNDTARPVRLAAPLFKLSPRILGALVCASAQRHLRNSDISTLSEWINEY